MKLGVSVAVCLWTCGLGALRAQTLEVTPQRLLADESATIRAAGLQPNQHVTIQADLVDGAAEPWSAQAEFVADSHGTVDAAQQAPIRGSYDEVSAMGLVWSMMPAAKHVTSYESPHDLGPQRIDFRLLVDGKPVSTVSLEQLAIADGVRQINVDGAIHGVLFVPGTSRRHPGVIVLGGSEGGAPLSRAAWLASHGFEALALAYFRYANLPSELQAIPLEYFGSALGWMLDREDILADKIAVVGVSRGGELALQLGSMYPQIRAVVAYVPANVRYAACCGNTRVPFAWTWKGQPLSFLPARSGFDPVGAMNAAIAVEHTHGPLLLISGEQDGVWPSAAMSDAVVSRLRHAHFAHPVEHWNYPHAGHRAGRPEIVPTWHGKVKHPVSGRDVDLGGTAQGDALSSLDAIPKVLEFLQKSLETAVGEP